MFGAVNMKNELLCQHFLLFYLIYFLCVLSKSNVGLHIGPTPRNLVVITCVIGTPFITSDIWLAKGILFLCDLKIMKFVYLKLRVSLFAQNQSATSDNSSFTILNRESNEAWEWKIFVSSAIRTRWTHYADQ